MRQPKYNNAAGYLLAVLTDTEKTKGPLVADMWCEVFGIKRDDPAKNALVYHRLFEMTKLLDEIEERIRETEVSHAEVYVRSFPEIRAGLVQVNLAGAVAEARNRFNPSVLANLEFCAIALEKQGRNDEPVTEDEFDEIHRSMADLFIRVRNSELHKPLKEWLLKLLMDAQAARWHRRSIERSWREALPSAAAEQRNERPLPSSHQSVFKLVN